MNAPKPPLPGIYLLVPFFVASFLYFTNLSKTDLWTPDEPRYALAAREMLDRGSVFQPYVNGEKYTEKPPLFFWTAMAFSTITGEVNQLAVRLPSACCAIGTILLMTFFIRQFFDARSALAGTLVLAVSPLFFWLARSGHIDMLLTFLTTAALVSFYRWYAAGGGRYLAVFYLCMALAALAKGPVGIALPLFVAVAFLLLRREKSKLLDMRLHIGLPIVVAAVLAWYIPVSRQAKGYEPGAVFWQQIFGRIFTATSHGVSPWVWPFYQIVSLIGMMLPWTILLPTSVISAARERTNPARFFLLVWAGTMLAFFTIIAEKRALYLLPMLPAVAGLLGIWLCEPKTIGGQRLVRVLALSWGFMLIAASAAVIAALPAFLARKYPEVSLPPAMKEVLVVWVASGLAVLAVAFASRETRHLLSACIVTAIAVLITVSSNVLPWVNIYKSPRPICQTYLNKRHHDSQAGMLGTLNEEYAFYSRSNLVRLESPQDLKSFFDSNKLMFCYVDQKQYEMLLKSLDVPIHVLDKRRVSSRVELLLCNRDVKGTSSER